MLKDVRGYGLHFLDACDQFQKAAGDQPVELEFPFPDGSGAPVVEIERMEKGIWPVEAERAAITSKVLRRGLLRAIGAAITSADDVPGAQKAMQSGKTSVAAAKFQLAIAGVMSTTAKYFGERYVAESDKRKVFLERTVETAKKVRAMKPEEDIEKTAKKLQEGAEKELKKMK